MPRAENEALYLRYKELANRETGVTFVGRLAQYRYYNMDQVAGAALVAARRLLGRADNARTVLFFVLKWRRWSPSQVARMENILTAAELKRRGMAAIESSLEHGPVHIFKRNRLVAIVLSEAEYQRLLSEGAKSVPGMTALEWLLSHQSKGKLTKGEIDQGIQDERA